MKSKREVTQSAPLEEQVTDLSVTTLSNTNNKVLVDYSVQKNLDRLLQPHEESISKHVNALKAITKIETVEQREAAQLQYVSAGKKVAALEALRKTTKDPFHRIGVAIDNRFNKDVKPRIEAELPRINKLMLSFDDAEKKRKQKEADDLIKKQREELEKVNKRNELQQNLLESYIGLTGTYLSTIRDFTVKGEVKPAVLRMLNDYAPEKYAEYPALEEAVQKMEAHIKQAANCQIKMLGYLPEIKDTETAKQYNLLEKQRNSIIEQYLENKESLIEEAKQEIMAETVEAQQEAMEQAAVSMESIHGSGTKEATKSYSYMKEIVDFAQVPPEWLLLNDTKVTEYIKKEKEAGNQITEPTIVFGVKITPVASVRKA